MTDTTKYITIKFKKTHYKVNLENLCKVLSELSGHNINQTDRNKIKEYCKKFKLLNEDFFTNINNL